MIDTLTTYEAIAAAGIDDRGARAISKAIADSVAANHAELATKADLLAVKSELRAEIAALRTELKVEIAALRTELKTDLAALEAKLDARIAELRELIASTQNRTIIWNFGMLVTFAGVIIAGIKLL